MPTKVQNAKRPQESTQKRGVTRPLARQPSTHSSVAGSALLQRALASPDQARPSDILTLQRKVGNQAVTHLIQAKLTVGPAHDRYEQEADRVAEQVVSGQWSADHQQAATQAVQRQASPEEEEVQTKPLAASITPLVQREAAPEEEEIQTKPLVQLEAAPEEEEIQTKSLVQLEAAPEEEEVQTMPLVQRRSEGGFEAGGEIEQRLAASRGGGSPLSAETRAYMEPRFGADFSGVRIHAGAEAVQMNRELQARAFTHGQDIYLGAGAQAPGSEAGNRLLAHELTHTLQQGAVNRISRWHDFGHELVTLEALNRFPNVESKFSNRVMGDIVKKSGSLDWRVKPIAGIAFGTMGGLLKKFGVWTAGLMMPGRVRAQWKKQLFEANAFHMRPKSELPNHAEAGAYRHHGHEAENIAQINAHLDRAVAAANKQNLGDANKYLAYALHTAEDRGAHGEGNPGTGHDPRCTIPPAEAPGGVNRWYRAKNWHPDDLGINADGKALAIGYAVETLENFYDRLSETGKDLIGYEFGSSFDLGTASTKKRGELAKKLKKGKAL